MVTPPVLLHIATVMNNCIARYRQPVAGFGQGYDAADSPGQNALRLFPCCEHGVRPGPILPMTRENSLQAGAVGRFSFIALLRPPDPFRPYTCPEVSTTSENSGRTFLLNSRWNDVSTDMTVAGSRPFRYLADSEFHAW